MLKKLDEKGCRAGSDSGAVEGAGFHQPSEAAGETEIHQNDLERITCDPSAMTKLAAAERNS